MNGDRDPAPLPIGQVIAELSRDYPDVTPSSLHFLEREGIVSVFRTAGGHRRYTRRDVERIRRVKEWQAQGVSLKAVRQRFAALDRLEAPATISRQFLEAAVGGDQATATRMIVALDELGMPLTTVFDEVLRPALVEVGARWQCGDLTIGQEHEISELTRDLVAELARRRVPTDQTGPSVVAACVAGELHDLGMSMVAAALRVRGADMHYIGADVAPPILAEVTRLRRPAIVLLSATLPTRLADVLETVAALSKIDPAHRPRRIVVGGSIVQHNEGMLRAVGVTPATAASLDAIVDELLAWA